MKTPEQMAEEFVYLCHNNDRFIAYAAFLAGYQAAKDQLQPQPFHKGADVYIIDANNPLPKPMPLSIAEQNQLADADKVMCNTTMEEVQAVDTGELMPITNLPTPAKWISVKERLPEDNQEVLIYTEGKDIYMARIYEGNEAYPISNGCGCCGFEERYTHWMLPEAPKGEG